MKTMSSALINLLATGEYEKVECWTLTLSGGEVIRWHGGDLLTPLLANGNTFLKGPIIEHGPISEKRGTETATLEVDITGLPSDLINGVPLMPFIANHGLDGANFKLERAFAPDWPTMAKSGATGTVVRFAGRVTAAKMKGATAQVTVSSWLWLLSNTMPRNLYQSGCLNALYDSSCGLNAGSFATVGHTTSAGGTSTIATSLVQAGNNFAIGRMVFSSGPNNGVTRTIKGNDGSGNFTLVPPLPAPCGNGDVFTAYWGCDLTQSTCTSKFNNLANFRATPFVPIPTVPLGSATTQPTSTGKG